MTTKINKEMSLWQKSLLQKKQLRASKTVKEHLPLKIKRVAKKELKAWQRKAQATVTPVQKATVPWLKNPWLTR